MRPPGDVDITIEENDHGIIELDRVKGLLLAAVCRESEAAYFFDYIIVPRQASKAKSAEAFFVYVKGLYPPVTQA